MFKVKDVIGTIVIRRFVFIPTVFVLAGMSCHQDVIDVDLSEIESQIVIEGTITNEPGPHTVKISRRESPLNKGTFPPVSNALVILYDDAGHSETLAEPEQGIYKTNGLQGVSGRTYTLNVSVEGETYKASCRMPYPVVLDSVSFFRVSDPYVGAIAFPTCYFSDPEGREDYCRFKFYRNGSLFDYEYVLYHGKYSDGERIVMDDLSVVYYQNDVARIELLTIDEAMYEYWSTLNKIIDSDDDDENVEVAMFPVTLFNPTSNLSNNALGYFSAHTVRTYTFMVR